MHFDTNVQRETTNIQKNAQENEITEDARMNCAISYAQELGALF